MLLFECLEDGSALVFSGFRGDLDVHASSH
jgi:hypothetical protein